jgi:hypothetical protein
MQTRVLRTIRAQSPALTSSVINERTGNQDTGNTLGFGGDNVAPGYGLDNNLSVQGVSIIGSQFSHSSSSRIFALSTNIVDEKISILLLSLHGNSLPLAQTFLELIQYP